VASPLRILHITDPHLHASREARMRGVNTDETLVATLAHALAGPRQPDLVLATGDLVQDETRAGYERFKELLGAVGLPVYCLPGNHDDPDLMRDVLSCAPFQFCGTATHGAWSLVMLNSYAKGDDGGVLTAEDLDLLERTLARAASAHVLITLHHQPVPMGSLWLDSVPLRNADEFLAICDRHPRIRAIVWGHVHQASDRERRGVHLLSSPSTCAQFKPGSDRFALDTRPPGYRWIDLHADGSIDTTVVWLA
jgi:3',5'-cyclic-AMP phosphodiesterase